MTPAFARYNYSINGFKNMAIIENIYSGSEYTAEFEIDAKYNLRKLFQLM